MNFTDLRLNKDKFAVMREEIDKICQTISHPKLKKMFKQCFFNTVETTAEFLDDGSVFILTGDIHAMWLRDSSAQVIQYMSFAGVDPDVDELIRGLIKRQLFYILQDPYANSFNKEPSGKGHNGDECVKDPYVWERKFEIDSLCYPLFLIFRYYQTTGNADVFGGDFPAALDKILQVFRTEQNHAARSDYYHFRPCDAAELSIPNRGHGSAVANNGLIWSGYRPSDDPCKYGYFIPGNMFASVMLGKLAEHADVAGLSEKILTEVKALKSDIDTALNDCAVVQDETYGKIFAFEVDGLGNYNLMDDANVPSLLGIPYIGYLPETDEVYRNTRRFVLSDKNPYYFSGKHITGIGSPHTPENYVWPISVIMQGLTTDNADEINTFVDMLISSDAGTGFMHEGVNKDNQNEYTREWFAWANSLFSYFLLKKRDKIKYFK